MLWESVILLHILLSFISIFSPNAWCQGNHLSSPSTLPLLFIFACICGLCSLGCSLVSGRRVVLEPPRTRQGHIFPTVVANGANGKTNCLKFCERSFWGRVWINYSVAAALCRRAPFLMWGVWYAVCSEELGLVHLFLVFRNLRWRK